jgi:S-adenosylmethionine synthetase
MAGVKVVPEQGYHLSDNIKSEIRSIVDEELANITRLTDLFVEGKLTLF